MRRIILLFALACLAAACTRGVEKARDALTSLTPSQTGVVSATASPTASPTSSPTGKPALVVKSPRAGDDILSPVTVRGTAAVFEGVVSIRIVDATGQELAAINARASCGTGCRGTFGVTLAFFTPSRQPGVIEVFEVSAKDGSVTNLVSVPVTLVPGS